MSTFDKESHYYSGQGVVMVGERDATGRPKGLLPVGNVSSLTIAIEESVLEHKESQTGTRGIDKRISTETKATLSMVMESFIAKNLALALRADLTEKKAGSVTNEPVKMYIGKVVPLANIKVSTVVVERGAQALTLYTNDTTPYDYKLNAEAGSIEYNDTSIVNHVNLAAGGTAVTNVAVGNPTVITVASVPANFEVGGMAAVNGFAGAQAALLNAKAFKITAKTATTVSLDVDTTAQTITTGTATITADGEAIQADYAYEAQNVVDALTKGSEERFLRFEGLNTADGNKPVVVEIFKFQVDPLRELGLINEEITNFTLEGNVLADSLQASGSNYFKETLQR